MPRKMNLHNKKILIVQRFFYSFREGFFDYLSVTNLDFKLVNHTKSIGRVRVNNSTKEYFLKTPSFSIGKNIVIFPLLFFTLIRFKPSIIITEGGQNTINNISVFIYCKLFNVKYIQWDLGRGYYKPHSNLFRNLYLYLYKIILKEAELVYGYNSLSKNYFESLGIKSEKITVLNNTIDTREILKNEGLEFVDINNLGFKYSKSKVYFIFVGTLLPTKNIESLANILKLLGDNYYLILIGSGTAKYLTHLKSIFKDTNHSFIGYKNQNDLYNYMSISSFAILPGLGGLSINLAMAYGLPVLCKNADGGELDLVRDNETGYIYNSDSEVVEYILSKSKTDWEMMGKKAKQIIINDFTIEKQAERFSYGIKKVNNGQECITK